MPLLTCALIVCFDTLWQAPSAMSLDPEQYPGGLRYLLFELGMRICSEQQEVAAERREKVAIAITQ